MSRMRCTRPGPLWKKASGRVAASPCCARAALSGVRTANMAQESGVKIVYHALEGPLRQIVMNAGGEPDVVVEKVVEGKGDFGYNAATEEYGSLLQMGIIDPTKVTRLALQNAASIASLILTTDCIVVDQMTPAHRASPAMPEDFGM